ncbi:MAG: O-antigen ligase family protein [Pseudomonadota bacterium]
MSGARLFYWGIWALLTLGVMRTTVLIRRRDTADFAALDSSALMGVVITAALLAALLLTPRTIRMAGSIARSSAAAFLAYLALALASVLWSQLPLYSAFRALEVLAVFLAAFIVMSRYPYFVDAERALMRFLMLVTLMSWGQRAMAGDLSLSGLHTNVYSVTAGMGALYAFGESLRAEPVRKRALKRWMWAFLVFLAIGTSVGSNIGAALGFVAILAVLGLGRALLLPAVGVVVALLALSGALGHVLESTVFGGRSAADLATLTGRNTLWTGYIEAVWERPGLGYGFAVGARIGDAFGLRATTNTHNGLIEAALGMGLAGLALCLIWWGRHFHEIALTLRAQVPGAIGAVGASVMLFVNNNSKSIIGGGYDPTFAGAALFIAFFHVMVFAPLRAEGRAGRGASWRWGSPA